jgi:hypothetical protein
MSDFVTGQQTPGTVGTPYNLLAFVFGQLMQQIQTVSLVKVLSCTNNGGLTPVGRVSVQPLVVQVSGDNVITPHGEIADLPYMRLQGGHRRRDYRPQAGRHWGSSVLFTGHCKCQGRPAGAVCGGRRYAGLAGHVRLGRRTLYGRVSEWQPYTVH